MTAARSLARLSEPDTQTLDKYWRAANYLAACQIYLMDNPLLADPLQPDQIKPRLLGHWGTTPGLNFVWAHLNRAIRAHDQEMMIVVGPGHGGPAALANTWLEGSYSEVYPSVPRDLAGMRQLFRRGKAGHRPRRPECGERGKRPGLDPQRLRCPLSAADPVG